MATLLNTIKRELFSELVGYKKVYLRHRATGDLYVTERPVYKAMSNRAIAEVLVKGTGMAILCYILLVLVIGLAPIN